MRRYKSGLLFVLILFCGLSFKQDLFSQTNDSIDTDKVNHLLWIDLYPHFYINEKLEYYGDVGYRTIFGKPSWSWIYVRPSLRYHINSTWDIRGGVGFFYVIDKTLSNRLEIRPWQGIQLNWPTWVFIGFKHLVRLEERFYYHTDDWSFSFDLRFRYKLSGNIDFCADCFLQDWYMPFYGEVFFPLGNEIDEVFRNMGRTGLGLGYYASKNWRISFNMNWHTSRAGPDDEFNVSSYVYQVKIRKLWKSK